MIKSNETKAFDGYGAEFLHRTASMYFRTYGDIPPMECCTYDKCFLEDRFSSETLRFYAFGFDITVMSSSISFCLDLIMSDETTHCPVRSAFISMELLPFVEQALNSANDSAVPIVKGIEGMYRIASMYYTGMPELQHCKYSLYCFDSNSFNEEISFYFSGFDVSVKLYGDDFITFSEYDSDHRRVRYDCMSSSNPDYMPFIAQAVGFQAADAADADAAGSDSTQESAFLQYREVSPLSNYATLLDKFLDAATVLRCFTDPSPQEPAYISACAAYSEVLCKLLSFAFPSGIRVQAEVVPEYIDEDYSLCHTVGMCRCGNIVGSPADYCSSCGALLRWSRCCPT